MGDVEVQPVIIDTPDEVEEDPDSGYEALLEFSRDWAGSCSNSKCKSLNLLLMRHDSSATTTKQP